MLRTFLMAWVAVWLSASWAVAQEAGAAGGAGDPADAAQAEAIEPGAAAVAEADAAPAVVVDLSSPRATVRTFREALSVLASGRDDAVALDAAVETLALPEGADRGVAVGAIEALAGVLLKLGEPEPLSLPDASDVRSEGATRYVYFPRGSEHAWVWEELAKFNRWPEGRVVLADTDPGPGAAWRFSAETVAGATRLVESLGPLPPKSIAAADDEGSALAVLGPTFERTVWWGWLALLGAIFVGLTAGKLGSAALRAAGKRLRDRGWPSRALVFESLASPASLALLTLGLAVGLRVFVHLDEDVQALSFEVIQFLYLIAAGWALYNLVDVVELGLQRVVARTHNRLDDMVVPLIRKSLRVFILVVFFLVVAQNVFGLDITGWLAGLGIAGLAVSLAAQDSVKNLFGSLTVFFDKPFAVGDFVSYGGYTGTVEEIGFRSTRLRLVSGAVVTVPNMKWIDNEVENIAARPSIRREMNITITYDTPPAKIEEAVRLVKEVLSDPAVVEGGRFDLEKQPPRVSFNELNADSLNIRAYYWYQLGSDPDRNFFTWLEHCEVVNLLLFRRFAEAGIDFAFPTQTLYLANDDKRQLAVRPLSGAA